MSKTNDIMTLLENGYLPYTPPVNYRLYAKLGCPHKNRVDWFLRPRQKKEEAVKALCLGCRKRCSLVNPRGWPEYAATSDSFRPGTVAYGFVERISVTELLDMKRVLRVDEAAWALNVSSQTVRRWIEDGRLERVAGDPLRITSASIDRILQPIRPTG